MVMRKEVVRIRVDLVGERAREFLMIKKKLGLQSNAEVIRNLVHEKYDTLNKT